MKFGSWEINPIVDAMPQKVATAFSELAETLVGASYEPIAYLGSQTVNGINHAVDLNELCGDKPLSWFLEGSETQMANNTTESKFSAANLVKFVKGFVGQPYWYGTCVYKCTEALIQKKAKQYPDAYSSSSALKRYRQNVKDNMLCADCIGLNF
jgi:hypothetical protein